MFNTELSDGKGIVRIANHGLSPLVHKEITDLLNRRLADTLDLMLQAKQAHWTVTGRNFLSLHELFDKIAAGAAEFGDLLAERTMQLGGRAEGTAMTVVSISQLEPYPVTLSSADEHVERMSSTLAAYAHLIRTAIGECEDRDDPVTADIFTEIGRAANKWRWLVEAHKGWR
jgi:starvation-inducible DNA-binding protein